MQLSRDEWYAGERSAVPGGWCRRMKLESQKDEVEYLVIDRIEPPSPN